MLHDEAGRSPRTGQPGSSLPLGRSAWTKPSELPKIISLRLSPSRSANAGEDSPSPVGVPPEITPPALIAFEKPGIRSASRCR